MHGSSSMQLISFPLNQLCRQINASTDLGVNELLKLSITLPPVLKADSNATVET
ncbi:hypothetical protein RchiOBHm_Chr1g0353831 [Rosa chinensis]|uniref:Uncharacterized protein n=1 Tax=Rosa chinensis TaxID=74649 RepID=A0A2P6SGX4_ROSCH|nr:hypothetical protein RchiOBHm_Chr1g0353831 [Rosa chinensis]